MFKKVWLFLVVSALIGAGHIFAAQLANAEQEDTEQTLQDAAQIVNEATEAELAQALEALKDVSVIERLRNERNAERQKFKKIAVIVISLVALGIAGKLVYDNFFSEPKPPRVPHVHGPGCNHAPDNQQPIPAQPVQQEAPLGVAPLAAEQVVGKVNGAPEVNLLPELNVLPPAHPLGCSCAGHTRLPNNVPGAFGRRVGSKKVEFCLPVGSQTVD